MDLTIHSGNAKATEVAEKRWHDRDGSHKSVRAPNPGNAKRAKSFQEGSKLLTVKSFLGTRAIRAKHSMDDIDYCSNNNSTPCHLQKITVPILILGMGGHYFLRDNEIHYEVSASSDREYIVIEGASHGIRPCTSCESFPGQYSNTVKIPSITLRSGSTRASEGNEPPWRNNGKPHRAAIPPFFFAGGSVLSSQRAITAAICRLFFSSIMTWLLPRIPRSASLIQLGRRPACWRYFTVQWS